MHPDKVDRARVRQLTDLPNVGPAAASDLRLLGIHSPHEVAGQDPMVLYRALCEKTGVRQDPCVLDVFMSIVSFANGEAARAWWEFTPLRKAQYPGI